MGKDGKIKNKEQKEPDMPPEFRLRYGCNPQQSPACVYMKNGGQLPFQVVSSAPGYINLLDALNSWQLVWELKQLTGLPSAASFKHVSPSGAAIAIPLSEILEKIYFVHDMELSPLAIAYARARGADRMSSFGDWVALSDPVDFSTAKLISREVSDGVIAPAYEPEALEILKKKKQGKYVVIQMDPAYQPDLIEVRDIFGVTVQQHRNDRLISPADFSNIVTRNKEIPENAVRDMLIASTTLKYTQSNSVCFAADGQVIGVGAGQQSRVHCTRLAGAKADLWQLRQHPSVLGLPFKPDVKRPDRDNVIDQFLQPDVTDAEKASWSNILMKIPRQLTAAERRAWLDGMSDVVFGSDAFFPFRDSIDRASKSGVKYVVQPGGSNRDEDVIAACDEYGMAMVFSGVRLFHH
jgi:phosphoribosylaminoimidazolecarboxamide formyltransferase/IMP cyclohydrolase